MDGIKKVVVEIGKNDNTQSGFVTIKKKKFLSLNINRYHLN